MSGYAFFGGKFVVDDIESFFGAASSSYTRADMLTDGSLVAASEELCRDAGILIPVAYTRTVWADCIAWPDDALLVQDEVGREWDVLWMAGWAIKGARESSNDLASFQVARIPVNARDCGECSAVWLQVYIGPGDSGEPVFTIRHRPIVNR